MRAALVIRSGAGLVGLLPREARRCEHRFGFLALGNGLGAGEEQRGILEAPLIEPTELCPDHIRLGLSPLYTSFAEVWEAIERMRRVVQEKRYLHYASERLPVT